MKKILTLILTIILGVSAVGCNLTSKEVKIISGNSLDGISISKLIKEENEIKKGYNTTYNIENNKEKLEKSLDNEKYDIAIVPTDMATKVYNKNSNYQICASIGEGSYYLVTSDPTITGFNSTLINKDVAIIEENSMIDIISKSILNKNNVDDSKVNFKYVSSAPEIVTTLALGNIRTGIVPETSLTTLLYKHSGLKILTSTNEAYEKAFNIKEGYSQFSIIVKKDFAKDNKEYVNEFLSKVKSSIDFVNKNPLQAGAYGEELSIPIKPQVLSKAIKRCNLKFIIVDEFKNNYKELFNILYNYNKEAVGGTVIDESIYYK
ncbi:MAG: ABC transporter substrate-binding protein [Terrisporobacter sp.]|uniref:ABC transporter substrate-binding protein n=1 Tax=Terrisporobacter sp. TaxID=1965305 RepID=UPI003991DD34